MKSYQKKLLVTLALFMLLALAACEGNVKQGNTDAPPPETSNPSISDGAGVQDGSTAPPNESTSLPVDSADQPTDNTLSKTEVEEVLGTLTRIVKNMFDDAQTVHEYDLNHTNAEQLCDLLLFDEWVLPAEAPSLGIEPACFIYSDKGLFFSINPWETNCLVVIRSELDSSYSIVYIAPRDIIEKFSEFLKQLSPM